MQALREQIAGGDVCLSSLPLDDFVRRLQRARGLITSPGLEVIYEAFTLGVPTCILPPQNNSQAYQARELRLVVPLLAGLDWQELVSIDLFSQDLSPAELIRGALDCVGCLRESPQAQHRMRETIAGFLGQDAAGRERVRQQQFQFIERMRAEADVHRIEELDLRIGSLLE